MATSGTTNFESGFLIDDIIEEAYNRVGLDSVSGYQLKSARRSLNIMFQEWANRGLHYWELGNLEIDLVEGQAEYKFFRNSADGTSATSIPNGVYGVDDVLDSYYIFVADFDDEEYFNDLFFSISPLLFFDGDVHDDRSLFLEDEFDLASDLFSLYFIT